MSDMSDIGGVPEIVVSLMQMPEELKQELLRYRLADYNEKPDLMLDYFGGWYRYTGHGEAGIPLVLKERND